MPSFEFVDRLVDLADAVLQLRVVGVRDSEELDSLLLHLGDGGENIFGGEGEMLHTRALVKIEILLDLRFAASLSRLVNGKFDVAIAVRHHLRHEGGVLGGDVTVVEVLVEREAHHFRVEVDPLVHGVPADVADDVVDVQEADGPRDWIFGDGAVAGEEGSGVMSAVDEGVEGVAVGCDTGGGNTAVGVGELFRLLDAARAAARGLKPGLACIVDPERDGADSVAVLLDVAGDVGVGPEGGGEDESDFALLQDVAGAVTMAGFRACVRNQRHAEGGTVEIGCLTSVAHVELDVIRPFQGQEVGGRLG